MTQLDRRTLLGGLIGGAALGATLGPSSAQSVPEWPHARPKDVGLDRNRLSSAADILGSNGERQGLVVIRDGRLVFERYWANDFHRADPQWRNVSFSAGKSWGATMVGRAITQRRMAVTDNALRYVPAERTGLHRETTIADLLTMSSGGTLVTKPSSLPPRRLDDTTPPGPAPEYRRAAGQSEERGAPAGYGTSITPGTRFFYDGAAADHLAEIVSAAVGQPSHTYMLQQVLAPLGCRDTGYQPEGIDRNGDVRIGGSMLISCRDLARLGQLYMDAGHWNGHQFIDPAFIRAAISPSPLNLDYGYLWWLNTTGRIAQAPRSMYFAAGARGQFCFVVPERRLVVATMGFGKAQLSTEQAWAALAPALLA